MRKNYFLFLIIISLKVNSQNAVNLQQQIDSLKQIKRDYEMKINNISAKITELEKNKSTLEVKDVESIEYLINQKLAIRIREKDNSSGSIIAEPKNGEKINLLDYKDSGYWVVSYKGKIGFLNEVFIISNPSIEEFKRNIITLKTKRENQQRTLSIAAAKESLIKEYGAANAERILQHQYWIGMTDTMARESLGSPDDINSSVGSWGTHEQWVYDKKNLYLYFENGYLTSFQN